jgi:hypothetical protein
MAIPQQQQPAGGLNQVRPAAPAQPAKQDNPAAQAVRVSGMEQEQTEAPQDYFTKSLEDLRKQRETLNSQMEKLKASLDSRQGLPFDPMLMKVAAGFAKPTKTGSFGESMGYAAEAAADEAEKQFARQQAINKMKLELDEKSLALGEKGLAMEDLLRLSGMGGAAPRAPSVGGTQVAAAPTGTRTDVGGGLPTGGGTAPTTGVSTSTGRVGATGAPNALPPITDSDITRAYAISKEHGDKVAAIAKMQREDIKEMGGRPYSTSRQQYLDENPNKVVERNFGRFIGDKKVTIKQAQEYDAVKQKALELDDPEIELNWFKKQGWLEGGIKPTKEDAAGGKGQPSAGGKDGAPLTVEQRKIRDDAITDRLKRQNEEESKKIGELDTNMKLARTNANIARDMKQYAISNPRAFELMQDATIKDAILRSAEKGIQAGNLGSISLPTRELSTYKLTQEDREALQLFMQKYAQLTVQSRKVFQGQGAVTEREGQLAAELEALPTDTARVIRVKSEALELRAEYDKQLFRAWNKFSKNPEATYRDFLASDEKSAIDDAYDQRLDQVRQANTELFGSKKSKTPKASSAEPKAPESNTPAKPTRAGAGQPPRIKGDDDPVYKNLQAGDLYIAPDGTVKKKR